MKTYLQELGQSEKTISGYLKNVYMFVQWCEDENIESEFSTYNDLLAYIKFLQKRKGRNGSDLLRQITLKTHLSSLKHYFNWCVKRELRGDNPVLNIQIKGIQRKSLYTIIAKEELEKLYKKFQEQEDKMGLIPGVKNSWTSKRNKVILGLLIWQGLDSGNIERLKVNDVKLREGNIYIAGARKSNERILKLEAHQILDVMEYILQDRKQLVDSLKIESEQLFFSVDGSLNVANFMAKFLLKIKKINPQIKSLKQIRTSVITYWLKNYNLREVQYMAGHRYVSSTEAYLINDLDDLQEDINLFHPFT